VWAADVTYIPMACGFLYLVAIIDLASRAVLAWRLSNTNDTSFCAAALEEALLRFGKPRIFNTDQGSTFTAEAFTSKLVTAGVVISMDGRGRFMDNIFIEAMALDQVRRCASESLRRWLRGAVLDELLQFSTPSPGDGQPDADGGVAAPAWTKSRRRGLWICRFAWTTQTRCQHIHSRSNKKRLDSEGQRQARLHLRFNDP
jgi:transposase InsO family protein